MDTFTARRPPPPRLPAMEPTPPAPPRRWRAVLAAVESMQRDLERRILDLGDVQSASLAQLGDLTAEMGEWSASLKAAAAAPSGWLAGATATRLVVHTVEDKSIEGTLALSAVDGLVLRAAKLIDVGGRSVDLAGEVFVPRAQVLMVQTKPA